MVYESKTVGDLPVIGPTNTMPPLHPARRMVKKRRKEPKDYTVISEQQSLAEFLW